MGRQEMPVLSRATCFTCPSASQWSSSLSPLVVVAKVRIDFSTVPFCWLSSRHPTTVFWWTSKPQQRSYTICICSLLSEAVSACETRDTKAERREVRETNTQVPSRAPLHHSGRHFSLRNAPGSASNSGSLTPSFNDLVSPLCWILPHFHPHL